jgi:hypothetical protein
MCFLTVSPLEVTILGKSSRITAGRKYDLLCQSVGSRPPAHITWWLDDQRLESAKETVRGETITLRLPFLQIPFPPSTHSFYVYISSFETSLYFLHPFTHLLRRSLSRYSSSASPLTQLFFPQGGGFSKNKLK